MGRLLQVAELGHCGIRAVDKDVADIHDVHLQELIDDMIATVKEVRGVGIAACQVYRSLRLFIVASHPNHRYPQAPLMEPLAMINPSLDFVSEVMEKDWEGCLSVPGVRGLTPRSREVTITFIDRYGKSHCQTYKGFLARIIQHEYDHLEGRVFLDRLDSMNDVITEKEFQKRL